MEAAESFISKEAVCRPAFPRHFHETDNFKIFFKSKGRASIEAMRKTHMQLPMAQAVKNLPAIRETWVPSSGREYSLEKGPGTHSSIFAWRIPWTEELVGL